MSLKQKAREVWGWEDEVILPHPEDVKHLLSAREPQGSPVHSPKKGHPEQESPMGPCRQPGRVTSMVVTDTVRGQRSLCQLQGT